MMVVVMIVRMMMINVIKKKKIKASVPRMKPDTGQVILVQWLARDTLRMLCTHLEQDHRP